MASRTQTAVFWLSAVTATLRRAVVGRTPRQIAHTIAIGWRKLRHEGVSGVLRQVRDAPNTERQQDAFRAWIERNTPSPTDLARLRDEAARLPWRPLVSVITPVFNTDPEYLTACIESVRAQAYPHWELCLCDDASTRDDTHAVLERYADDARIKVKFLRENSGISRASNAALEMAAGEFVALLDHDDELTPDALFEVARFLNEHRDADMVYSDEDKLDLSGERCDPYFKPGWSPEHFLGTMYTCHLMAVRRSLISRVGGFRPGYEGAQDYDLVLRLMEHTDRIHHLPRILYHWRKIPGSAASVTTAKPWALDAGRKALEDALRRRGIEADVVPGNAPGLFRVKHAIAGEPRVSILIPTRGAGLLGRCLASLSSHNSYKNIEVVIVADGALPSDVEARARALNARVLRYDEAGPFNFSRKINVGARHATGEHLLLLNDDVEAVEDEWLAAMLEYSQQPSIGAVGAKLVYPDGRLQHAGILLGVCGVAAHAFHQASGSCVGYASSVVRPGNFSAVSAACLMTRREVFEAAGGLDEKLPVDFNDVDYCLKLRMVGYRIVFTPYARLIHHESASLPRRVQDEGAAVLMRERWRDVIADDPYYNPHLTRDFPDYRLRSG